MTLPGPYSAAAFSANQQYGFVGTQSSVNILDLRNPNAITVVSTVNVGAAVRSMTVTTDGRYLIVATDQALVTILIQDPLAATVTNTIPTQSPPISVNTNPKDSIISLVSNTTLVVYSLDNGNLTAGGNITLKDGVTSVQVTKTGELIVQTGNATVVIDPNQGDVPVVVSRFETNQASVPPIFSYPYMLLAGDVSGITVYRAKDTNWTSLNVEGYLPTDKPITTMAISLDGKNIVFSTGDSVQTVQLIAKPAPLAVPLLMLENTIEIDGSDDIRSVLYQDSLKWTATASGDMMVLTDTRDLQSPVYMGNLTFPDPILGMEFTFNPTIVALWTRSALYFVNVAHPSEPQIIRFWEDAQDAIRSLTLSGPYAYVMRSNKGVQRLDMSQLSVSLPGVALSGVTFDSRRAVFSPSGERLLFASGAAGFSVGRLNGTAYVSESVVNTPGIASHVAWGPGSDRFYGSDSTYLRKYDATSKVPIQIGELDLGHPIQDLVIGQQGTAIFVGLGPFGMAVVDTDTMLVKQTLAVDSRKIRLSSGETEAIVAGADAVKWVQLILEPAIFSDTPENEYPVGIDFPQTLSFFDSLTLEQVDNLSVIDIGMMSNGKRIDLPEWIRYNDGVLSMEAPKSYTGKEIVLSIFYQYEGVKLEALYAARVVPSLGIVVQGVPKINSPAPTVSVALNCSIPGAFFKPITVNGVSPTIDGCHMTAEGSRDTVNLILARTSIVLPPNVPTAVANRGTVQMTARDTVNLGSVSREVPTFIFTYDKAPTVIGAFPNVTVKALEPFDIPLPANIVDPGDILGAASLTMADGTPLPHFFTFSGGILASNGIPVSEMGKTFSFRICQGDGIQTACTTEATDMLLTVRTNIPPYAKVSSLTQEALTSNPLTFRINTSDFVSPLNNTLKFEVVEEGKTSLPGIIRADVTADEIAIEVNAGPFDWNTIRLSVFARDIYGGEAVMTVKIRMTYYWLDGLRFVAEIVGIVSLPLIIRAVHKYMQKQFKYVDRVGALGRKIANGCTFPFWYGKTVPQELLSGQGYYPEELAEGGTVHVSRFSKTATKLDRLLCCVPKSVRVRCSKGREFELPDFLDFSNSGLKLMVDKVEDDGNFYFIEIVSDSGRVSEAFIFDPRAFLARDQELPTLQALVNSPGDDLDEPLLPGEGTGAPVSQEEGAGGVRRSPIVAAIVDVPGEALERKNAGESVALTVPHERPNPLGGADVQIVREMRQTLPYAQVQMVDMKPRSDKEAARDLEEPFLLEASSNLDEDPFADVSPVEPTSAVFPTGDGPSSRRAGSTTVIRETKRTVMLEQSVRVVSTDPDDEML